MKKNVLLGVTGGIAAYKAVNVASTLTKKGYQVQVVMTNSAKEFVSPLTFRSITHNPVETDLFSAPKHFKVKHISLAEKSDIILIAPATANFIAKMAHGIADDLLSTIILGTKAPILLSPSMNKNMYYNPVVQDNLNILKNNGYEIINPSTGYLACGEKGEGRLPSPQILCEHVIKNLTVNCFQGKKILVTAGPTREALDSVRFLSNYSSGKMGYALAKAACYQGGDVTLVSGPTNLVPPPGVNIENVISAREMAEKVHKYSLKQDIIIMAAAVSDYRPADQQQTKIKKNNWSPNLELTSNPDILKKLGQNKTKNQILVGFAAETNSIVKNAEKKLNKKNLDLIIANDISRKDIGFNNDNNQVWLITKNQKKVLPKMSKYNLSNIILEEINGYIK